MRTSQVITALCLLAAVYADQTYQLVWSDEFNGNSLDQSKWGYQNICDGAGNNELECYTSRTQNVDVRNGSLVITPLVENYGGRQYTSGRISTSGKFSWKYGRFDVRAKLPNGLYLWPAIWMMPERSVYGGWAASGEIDIMENHGGQNNEHSSTLHYGGSWPKNIYDSSNSRYESFDLTKDFHVYSAIWTPQSIQFLLDDKAYYTISLQKSFNNANAGSFPYNKNGSPFDQEFHFILNLAIGGGFFGGNANSLTPAIARGWADPLFLVDYARVYQLKDGVVNNPTPSPTPAPTVSSADCTAMWNSLTCRPVDNADSGTIASSRDWLCNAQPQYCTEINGGKYTGCTAAQQIGYAMDLYYKDFKGDQGDGACSFGGLGVTRSPQSSTTTTQNATPTPTTQNATPTPTPTTQNATPTPTTLTCPAGQSTCQDSTAGATCYSPAAFDCVQGDDSKSHLCPKGTKACGSRTCYPPSVYTCTNGWLHRN